MRSEKMKKYKKILLNFIFSSSLLLFFPSHLYNQTGQFLLMQPIEDAIDTGDFNHFKGISTGTISVNLESPINLTGYISITKFIEDFTEAYSQFKTEKIEWTSKQIDGDYAVQSMNVILKNKRSRQEIYYKFIFFMKRNIQWEIYYLRGLAF
ncbi:MAG: hypothetical protein MUF15_18825 [Acidobacteria bacterium]|jgi:hypothetical protein|nr:hypothetical protein [Acidobacteriota bacterium]